MRQRLRLRGCAAALLPALAAAPAQAEEALAPYQVVRSLELVQDRIAGGDHALLSMQRKLLEMADARLRAMSAEDLAEPRNVDALLVYAMSGGNPTTLEIVLARLDKDSPARRVADGMLLYARGEPRSAQNALAAIDPLAEAPAVAAYVALIKGSVLAIDQPAAAVAELDKARLLAPGTLVEEAALRRSLALAATLRDAGRFMRAARQYVQAYLRSPYAAQFADAFVAGVVALHTELDLDAVGAIAAMMDAEREKVIYLRIARQAAIDGLTELSAFAAARAEGKDDPRAALYSSLSSVTTATVEELEAKLAGIDRDRLSEKDRRLLDAASAVAREVTAPPKLATEPAAAPVQAPDEAGAAPAPPGPDGAPPATAPALPAEAPADEVDAAMADARKKLAEIDKLLGETSH